MAELIDGKKVSAKIRQELKIEVETCQYDKYQEIVNQYKDNASEQGWYQQL